ncbi:hypothetical protein ANN_10056 [Periplaneta americana]|uniref:Uncharacterized protein n=1 Tax=Periplaneta americana TaxID=6978 RepID=A0ABQ8TN00_PERAM|nr:hypothetical protein ANN_10056 [Periplaneta americana]
MTYLWTVRNHIRQTLNTNPISYKVNDEGMEGRDHTLVKRQHVVLIYRYLYSITEQDIGHLPGTRETSISNKNTPILYMLMVCEMEVPCVPSLNMNDAFRIEGYHIEEYLLSMGLDERFDVAKERGNERGAIYRIFDATLRQPRATLPHDERDSCATVH